MLEAADIRYAHINLPHARTIVGRLERALTAFGVSEEPAVRTALDALARGLREFDEDPPKDPAIQAADEIAVEGRALVEAILETTARGDRLGQSVRNLFECLGLAEEGATLSLQCGERPDSLLR